MREQFCGLRAIRAEIKPGPRSGEESAIRLEQEVHDMERCLAGDPTSNLWQKLNVQLTSKKQTLLHTKRRLAGRTPQMDSWEDPL